MRVVAYLRTNKLDLSDICIDYWYSHKMHKFQCVCLEYGDLQTYSVYADRLFIDGKELERK